MRTMQQRERTLADWRRRGGREADQLLRLVAHPTRELTSQKIGAAREIALRILADDRARLRALHAELVALTLQCGGWR